MQLLDIPKWKWYSISMDFVWITEYSKGFNLIWVIVDRLTKLEHFILIKTSFPLQKLDEIYIGVIVKLHGIPSSIMSDRDPRFTSIF